MLPFTIYIEQIPVPKIDLSKKEDKKNHDQIVDLVEKILLLKEQNKDTTNLEEKIDQLVYELFDLTEEKIKIIEESK